MKLKTLSKRTMLMILLVGSVILLALLIFFINRNLTQGIRLIPIKDVINSSSAMPLEPTTNGLPVRLKIPTVGVDAAIESVALTSSGAMDVPKNPLDVAWYNLGVRPGESGSAVIDGHYGILKNGDKSVFDNLNKLHVGDQLSVEDNKGLNINFIVNHAVSYDPNADVSNVFESNDGRSHLNLITCEGVWSETSKSYSKRLVVFTDKE